MLHLVNEFPILGEVDKYFTFCKTYNCNALKSLNPRRRIEVESGTDVFQPSQSVDFPNPKLDLSGSVIQNLSASMDFHPNSSIHHNGSSISNINEYMGLTTKK